MDKAIIRLNSQIMSNEHVADEEVSICLQLCAYVKRREMETKVDKLKELYNERMRDESRVILTELLNVPQVELPYTNIEYEIPPEVVDVFIENQFRRDFPGCNYLTYKQITHKINSLEKPIDKSHKPIKRLRYKPLSFNGSNGDV